MSQQREAVELLAESQQKLARSQRLNVIFIGAAIVLGLFLLFQTSGQGRTIERLSRDVQECNTPSKRGDVHECYEELRAETTARSDAAAAQRDATKKSADDAAKAASAASAGAASAASAAEDAKAAAEFLSGCFGPRGACTRASEANQTFIRNQLTEVVMQVKGLEFRVSGRIDGGTFQGTARPAEAPAGQRCTPAVGIGGTGLLEGVLCAKP
jgi:hypothetical protein